MHVIILVASVAGCGRLVLIQASGVATLARDCAMLAEERVLRVSIMIEGDGLPDLFIVTLFALCSEVGPVNVVLLVARKTVCRGLVFVERARMATVAFRLSMVALEEIGSIPIVFKEQRLPVSFGVTPLAPLAETALVLIVFLVAGVAIDRSLVSIKLSFVTGLAFGGHMPAA